MKKINWLKFKAYRYNNDSIAIIPYLCIHYYKYKGLKSISCVKWNINFGWLVFGVLLTNSHR